MHLPPWHKIKQQYLAMVLPGQEDAAKRAEDSFSRALSELEVGARSGSAAAGACWESTPCGAAPAGALPAGPGF
jgi:hypothetical protein